MRRPSPTDDPPGPAPGPRTPGAARREVLGGLVQGAGVAAVLLLGVYLTLGRPARHAPVPPAADPAPPPRVAASAVAEPPRRRHLDWAGHRAPADVARLAMWIVQRGDNGPRPFSLVDKRRAQLYAFEASGRLLGTSPILLGFAAGDTSTPGIGDKALADIPPAERTTPAGRFESSPGRNTHGEDVVWVDYDAAVSMHRVRATNPQERRLERLATPTPADNRISWGCINVPVAFFDTVVWPHVGRGHGIVYVLPEQRPLAAFFPEAAAMPSAALVSSGSGQGNSAAP